MIRYTRTNEKFRNSDIRQMLHMLRDQSRRLLEEISMLEISASLLPPDELFHDGPIRDRTAVISLAAHNLSAEVTVLWKRTQ